jgi:hypothetical protein
MKHYNRVYTDEQLVRPITSVINKTIPDFNNNTLSNCLKLHLELNVLGPNEKLAAWIPGSHLFQQHPFIDRHPKSLQASEPHPSFLLLTSDRLLSLVPRLSKQTQDDPAMYFDAAEMNRRFVVQLKLRIADILRLDIGPSRQYLCFRAYNSAMISFMFLTRSQEITTTIVDFITTLLDPRISRNIINQDVEWFVRNLQSTVLLAKGSKSTQILSYHNVWDQMKPAPLRDEEYDQGLNQEISKVDFDFIRVYQLGVFLRYTKPLENCDLRGVQIQHVSFLTTCQYIYILAERLDVWPPAFVPPEYNPINGVNDPIEAKIKVKDKGLQIDYIPLFSVLGIGRVSELCKIEKRRSYKIDQGLSSDLAGLGKHLAKGDIGHMKKKMEKIAQAGSTSGWPWHLRLVFGEKTSSVVYPCEFEIPKSRDDFQVHYWWDLGFASKEATSTIIDALLNLNPEIEIFKEGE